MLSRSTKLLALAAIVAASGAGPAAAGSLCCDCAIPCAPVVGVVPVVTDPFLIVNQGPAYTGPGIVMVPGYVEVDTMPATYPYVGRDYYSRHVHVLQPGGFYSRPVSKHPPVHAYRVQLPRASYTHVRHHHHY